ncbi:hypothetical protein LX81_03455 [Palleronia aestuarii]|uniref:Exopolysaccharide synthesis protein ExoD n=2 Tax=Palleronia aestuarii TaxID=568105 RepID=A0A2W7N7Q5_9RHOB|nr:hypothetical protein LX81_03455 [Palleronia aestuarii]
MRSTNEITETRHHVRSVIEKLEGLTHRDEISVSDVVTAFGATAFLPVMMVPALLVVSPLSGIPLFSSICGITIALIAGQFVLRRPGLWLPGMILRRSVGGERLGHGLARLRWVADRIDRYSRDRLELLVGSPRVLGLVIAICGLTMPMLEIVPFSSSLLGFAVVCLVTALLAHDGLIALLGLGFAGAATAIPIALFLGIASA